MKRVFSILVAMLLVAVLLPSCGKKAVDTSEPDTQSSTVSETSDPANESSEPKESADAPQSNAEQPVSSVSTPANTGTSPDHKTPNTPNRNENTNTPSNSTPTTAPKAPETPSATTTTTTQHQHTYKDYKCTGCGEMDHAHAYEYLTKWVSNHGQAGGEYISYDYQQGSKMYSVTYSAQKGYLLLSKYEEKNGDKIYSGLRLSNYEYYVNGFDSEIVGNIDPNTFTNNSPITYKSFYGNNSIKNQFIELSRLSVMEIIEWLDYFLKRENIDLTISDFGFTSYKF